MCGLSWLRVNTFKNASKLYETVNYYHIKCNNNSIYNVVQPQIFNNDFSLFGTFLMNDATYETLSSLKLINYKEEICRLLFLKIYY